VKQPHESQRGLDVQGTGQIHSPESPFRAHSFERRQRFAGQHQATLLKLQGGFSPLPPYAEVARHWTLEQRIGRNDDNIRSKRSSLGDLAGADPSHEHFNEALARSRIPQLVQNALEFFLQSGQQFGSVGEPRWQRLPKARRGHTSL